MTEAIREDILMEKKDIAAIIDDAARKIYQDVTDTDKFAVIGLQTRGVELARRIRAKLESKSGTQIKSGVLDITFHRDDLATRGILPEIKETSIEFDIANMTILLVDDVIFTGRTIKAALEALMSFGRPRAIRLFSLIDRGNRELPIQPDYCGLTVQTDIRDQIKLFLKEVDECDDRAVIYYAGDE